MIEYEDDRTLSRYMLKAHHFNVPKIDAHRKSENGNNESGESLGTTYCTRFWLAMVRMFRVISAPPRRSPCLCGKLPLIRITTEAQRTLRWHREGPVTNSLSPRYRTLC